MPVQRSPRRISQTRFPVPHRTASLAIATAPSKPPRGSRWQVSDDLFDSDLPTPHSSPSTRVIHGDARRIPIGDGCVDLIVTSPPYWKKRDYGLSGQIGQEATPGEYISALMGGLAEWRRVLKPSGSVFLNLGDTYQNRSLAGIPALFEIAARSQGWFVRNRIVWAKTGGMPEPARDRLANRHEYIFHLILTRDYYYDLCGYSKRYGNGANPGDVWYVGLRRTLGAHLAPFPDELVERAITLACPSAACEKCGSPRSRLVQRTSQLDPSRPQARRAMELARRAGLTPRHIAAIQANGISDAGKALKVQNGTGRNSADVKALAAYAKTVLGGYFREFTFAQRKTVGWTLCSCKAKTIPGLVLDPFMGTGTSLRIARKLGRSAIGIDLEPSLAGT